MSMKTVLGVSLSRGHTGLMGDDEGFGAFVAI